MRRPTCGEVDDLSTAVRASPTTRRCPTRHRLRLEGDTVQVGRVPEASFTIALTERASSEAGAG